MIVLLDGRPLDFPNQGEMTLHTLIDAVRATHLPERLVVSVRLNGKALLDADLTQALEEAMQPEDFVELESADRTDLAIDALRGVAERIGSVRDELPDIAATFQAGRTGEAVRRIGTFVDAWQECRLTLSHGCRLLGRDLTAETYAGRSVREHLDDVVSKLRGLRDAFEAGDMVLVADLVQYELTPLCDTWGALLGELAESSMPAVSESQN